MRGFARVVEDELLDRINKAAGTHNTHPLRGARLIVVEGDEPPHVVSGVSWTNERGLMTTRARLFVGRGWVDSQLEVLRAELLEQFGNVRI